MKVKKQLLMTMEMQYKFHYPKMGKSDEQKYQESELGMSMNNFITVHIVISLTATHKKYKYHAPAKE